MTALCETVLFRLLSAKRRYGSVTEGAVIPYLLTCLPEDSLAWVDGAGNLHVDMRVDISVNRTLFVAHTDTQHRGTGLNVYRRDGDMVYADGDDCLGADDAVGVAILAQLIHCVPAYYIFTRGEEVGGIGSKYVASNYKELLKQFERAIAFDRADVHEVITHQVVGRCCSDEFAQALSDALSQGNLLYAPSDAGVYTDTAEWVDLVPECTNIGCGYWAQHGPKEHMNLRHVLQLCEAACKVQWDDLPTKRDPLVREEFSFRLPSRASGFYDEQEDLLNAMWGQYDRPFGEFEKFADAIEEMVNGDASSLLTVFQAEVDNVTPEDLEFINIDFLWENYDSFGTWSQMYYFVLDDVELNVRLRLSQPSKEIHQ
jgi:hypothetical protein